MMQHLDRPFLILLAAYLIIASLFAIYTPPWQAPDEPAHYNYIRELADGQGRFLPIMEPDDYNQAYQSEVISSRFDPALSIEPFRYQDYQPPLYYLLQAPIYALTGGALIPMRLFGILMGVGTAILAYLIFKSVLRTELALTAAGFLMFLPQHVAIQAGLNNDSLAELLIAAGLLCLTRHALDPERDQHLSPIFWTALILSLAMLTKVTAYLMVGVAGVYLIWWCWGRWGMFVQNGFRIFLAPTLVGGLWWGRNLAVYGWPDFLGTQAHDAAVIGQPTTAEWIEQFGLAGTLMRFRVTTFQSFWGQFGWMGVVLDQRIYLLLRIFSMALVIGLVLLVIFQSQGLRDAKVRPLYRIFGSLLLLNITLYLVYNISLVQHQGRYLFSSLIPISFIVAGGIQGWIGLIARFKLTWLEKGVPYVQAAGLLGLDAIALFFFIIPQLTL